MRFSSASLFLTWGTSLLRLTSAIQMSAQPTSDELLSAANQVKENMLTFYGGNKPGGIPGYMLNPNVYFWWIAGGMLGQLIHHWHITGNDTYNDLVMQALLWQSSDNNYLQPNNQSNSEGNDDQAFWAYAALDAAETNFPAPPTSSNISWLGLAQGVFNAQIGRWVPGTCNGGIRWQIYTWNKGYNYKNMPANGGLFQISARLARYTGNETYANWAEKVWQWATEEGLVGARIPDGNNNTLHVYDGFDEDKCASDIQTVQYTYNPGAMIVGCAYMYNHTNGNQTWLDRINYLINGLWDNQYLVQAMGNNAQQTGSPSFGGPILSETAVELHTPQSASNDQPSFKAYTIQWMQITSQLVPSLRQNLSAILTASAVGAAGQCIGQSPGGSGSTPVGSSSATPGQGNNWCGRRWYQSNWDGFSGMGEQMSAMSAFQNALALQKDVAPPLTANTGGNSISDPSAGTDLVGNPNDEPGGWIANRPITAADKFGASVLTILGVILPVGGLFFMAFGE